MMPRHLRPDDIPTAMELSAEAGWNQTAEDWRALIEWNAGVCFALECDGEMAATATLVCYGKLLGWVGMVLTRERYRRRGCARVLLEKLIGVAELRGIETLKLDATAMGEPLYQSLGFVAEQPVERWCGDLAGSGGGGTRAVPSDLDLEAFGVERTAILESLASRGKVTALDAGFAMTRPGRVARYLGPCVARDRTAAEEVIAMALSDSGLWYWDLLPRNAAAVSIATEHGFAPVRQLTRMRRGKPLRGRDEMVFAIGGFEIG